MSLRPDDRTSRSRSKSPGRSVRDRSRSRSHVRAPSPGPSATYRYSIAQGSAAAAGYEVRQPTVPPQVTVSSSGSYQAASQAGYYATPSSPLEGPPHHPRRTEVRTPRAASPANGMSNHITMGGYTDLPPHERPGYVQQQAPQGQYQYTSTPASAAAVSPPQIQYTAQPQYGQPSPPRWSYTATPTNAPAAAPQLVRNVASPAYASANGTYQYSQAPSKITYTAKPVAGSSESPSIPYVPHVVHSPPSPQARPQSQPQAQAQPPPPPQQQQQQQQQEQHRQEQQQQQPSSPPPAQQPPQYQQLPYPVNPSVQQPEPPEPVPPSPRHSPRHERFPSIQEPPPSVRDYNGVRIVEVTPGGSGRDSLGAPPSPRARPHSLSVHGERPDILAPPSPGLGPRMDRLSVSGNRPDLQTILPGQLPPPSPLLEAYHGVYQSISPMPSPIMSPRDSIDDLPPLEPLQPRHRRDHSYEYRRYPSADRRGGGESPHRRGPSRSPGPRTKPAKKEKRVKIYDAEEDALALVDALARRTPDADTLIDILPQLSHDQMVELRTEYKRHCKVQGRGVNVAKHIKMKVPGHFGKVCYVTALGRWEGEAYWANFWYQASGARRELLIEALMGRSNAEVVAIRDAFRDKRYGDSLVRCMDKELKADKFRRAVLLALAADRQEETEPWPVEYRMRDVDALYRALQAREGGESAILEVVITRSDNHLREVLRTYERKYGGNFARDALRKSNNLVGEIIAHILNGVINKPARDAMLLHHAITDLLDPAPPSTSSSSYSSSSTSPPDDAKKSRHQQQQHRHELLISRLVRLHWDRVHLARVKQAYAERYGNPVERDLAEAVKGVDYRDFALALVDFGG